MRQTPVWSNGVVAIVSRSSSPRGFSPVSPFAVGQNVRDGAAPIAAAGRLPPIRNIVRFVRIAAGNGGPAISITGGGDGRAILPSLNSAAKSSESGTRSAGCAILPTTTQLST